MTWNNWRTVHVRTQLLLALTFMIMLFVAQMGVSLILNRREEQAVNQLLETGIEIEQAQRLQVELQLARFHESNAALLVLLEGTDSITEDYSIAEGHITSALDILAEFSEDNSRSAEADAVHASNEAAIMVEIEQLLVAHQASLQSYPAELFPQRGDLTSGKVGNMMRPLQAVSTYVDASRAIELGAEYGLNLSPAASRKLPTELQILITEVEALDIQPGEPAELLALLESARTALLDLIVFDLDMYARLEEMSNQTESADMLLNDFIEEELRVQANAQARFDAASELRSNVQAGTALGVVVLGSFLALAVARFITRPITTLEQATSRLADGDYSSRVEISRSDEFGALANSFNQMADAIERRDSKIRQQSSALEGALAEAQEASKLKSEFLSTMSHELRTPLNAIVGFSGLLQMGIRGELPERALEAVDNIRESGEHLLALINDILDLSKIEAGRMEINSEPVHLAPLVEVWQTRTRVLAEKKGLDLHINLDPALPEWIVGDRERLTQIASNLLSNAVKFTEEGSVILQARKNDSTSWQIEVTDTGIGIAPEALEFIFDEFRQVDGTSTRNIGGTGLGLAITRRLAEIMRGSVQVRSKLGQGSTFTVSLPLIPASEVVDEVVMTTRA